MRKFFIVTIPIITLVLFMLVMLSGSYLKKPLGKDDNIPQFIEVVIKNIRDEKWQEAGENTDKLSRAWKKVVRRVQFSEERDEINDFTMSVARLRGGIMAKDKASSLSELSEAYEHWRELGK